jgi:hypothetical protein
MVDKHGRGASPFSIAFPRSNIGTLKQAQPYDDSNFIRGNVVHHRVQCSSNSTFPPCIFSREASYGVYLLSVMNQSQGMIFFLLKLRFFRQGSGCGCVCGVAPKINNKYFWLLEKRPWDGKVPLRDWNSYREEIYITPPLNRDRIIKIDHLLSNRGVK